MRSEWRPPDGKGGAKLKEHLSRLIRSIPDFPKKGILFRDITTLLMDAEGFRMAVEAMTEPYKTEGIDKIVCVEARGFILGGAMGFALGCGVVPVRKPGKLPYEVEEQDYTLEYGTARVEIHKDALKPGESVLIVDDLLATGGTARATGDLVERLGGKIHSFAFLVELLGLEGRKLLDKYDVFSVITYE
jgi:adenine phosphoribosyltransferase